ncbi:protein-export chaperone SecB [Leuconostoc lactis]|uniref:protein-export chaperone SecB n=1 Tax=Leuconostoc lactis TaxID=1246 RepID=UPI0025B22B72|nr:protein-export chaperone SecB [Leuconostoc lactis]MDN2649645.1 protein-export chaperone SecB [Leuconostoc lactis]
MAVINFLNYTVSEMVYKKNESFVEPVDSQYGYQPQFSYGVSDLIDDNFDVTLSVELDSENFPFYFKVEIVGKFTFNQEEVSEKIGTSYTDYKANALAIMFPYTRSLVSQLTLMSNEFQALQFPTINVNNFVENNDEETE